MTTMIEQIEKQEPIGVFGKGNLVVDTGTYLGVPAVFVWPSPASGKVGSKVPNHLSVDHGASGLVADAWFMTFPTDEQALMVADALCNATPPLPVMRKRWSGDYGKEINRIAILLLETWKQVDPDSSVALNDCSYQATFADMAKAIVDDQNTRYVPDVPELVRYSADLLSAGWISGAVKLNGEFVRYDQAVAVIADERQAAIDARNLLQYEKEQQWQERAEAAEAKLAQYEAQEPVAWMHPEAGWTDVCKVTVATHCKHGIEPLPLYASPAPAADLKAENEKLREALRDIADHDLICLKDPYRTILQAMINSARAALNPTEPRT